MGFVESIRSGFNNYATFQGRAPRSEFWWWMLFATLVNIATSVTEVAIKSANVQDFGAINIIATLILLLPGIAVVVRRLHDTDHSGWWYFIPLTIIGVIPFFIWMCSRGTPGANRFGYGTTADIAGVFGDSSPTYATAPSSFDRSRL